MTMLSILLAKKLIALLMPPAGTGRLMRTTPELGTLLMRSSKERSISAKTFAGKSVRTLIRRLLRQWSLSRAQQPWRRRAGPSEADRPRAGSRRAHRESLG